MSFAALLQALHRAKVIKDFLVYSFGSLILRAFSLIIVPFIMRVFSPAEYGALSLLTAFITIGSAVLGLGLRQLLSIEYFHEDHAGQKRIINELIVTYSIIALPLLLVSWFFRKKIIAVLFFESVTSTELLPAFLSLALFFYAELLYQILQYKRFAQILTVLQLAIAALNTCNTFYFVWRLKMGIAGVLWAQCIGQCVAALCGLYLYYQNQYQSSLDIKQSLQKIASHLKQGLPFIPGLLSSWLLASSDRWMLGYYLSMKEVGIYAVADLFAQLFNFVILVPWAGSYLPYIMQRYKENESRIAQVEKENKKTMWISMGCLCLAIGTIPIVRPALLIILPANYHASISYIWLLLLGQIFLLGSYFNSSLLQFRKKTMFLAIALGAPAFLNIFLNWMLIPIFGIWGCALATCLSYAFYFFITFTHSNTI